MLCQLQLAYADFLIYQSLDRAELDVTLFSASSALMNFERNAQRLVDRILQAMGLWSGELHALKTKNESRKKILHAHGLWPGEFERGEQGLVDRILQAIDLKSGEFDNPKTYLLKWTYEYYILVKRTNRSEKKYFDILNWLCY